METRIPPIRSRLRPPKLPRPVPPETGIPSVDDAKKLLDTSATTNRNLFVAFYLLLLTSLILCLSITDDQLLIGNAAVRLPGLNVDVPIWAFASVMPLTLIGMHFDLLHNLAEHSQKLKAWVDAWEAKYRPVPPVDGSAPAAQLVSLSHQLFPFLYDFAWLQESGRGRQSAATLPLPLLCWILYCWSPVTVLVIFMIRFADLQSYFYTFWHIALIVLDLKLLKLFWPMLAAQPGQRARKWLMRISTFVGCWTLALFILIQAHLDGGFSSYLVRRVIHWENVTYSEIGIALVPRITLPSYQLKISPEHFNIAAVLDPGKPKDQLWPETIAPLDLSKRRLGFAVFSGAAMPRVNLHKTKLQGADLTAAKLQGANLNGAQFQGANLNGAQLQGANLSGALLRFAVLQYADLTGATLHGADLGHSMLKYAVLMDSKLQGGNLNNAALQVADLSGAQLQGANLSAAKLQGADLNRATLQGAILEGTALHAALIPDTKALNATIGTIDWREACNFTELESNPWANSLPENQKQAANARTIAARQRCDTFKAPQLPPHNRDLFIQSWKKIVCTNQYVARGMLVKTDIRTIPPEIDRKTLLQWMKSHDECIPYIDLLPK